MPHRDAFAVALAILSIGSVRLILYPLWRLRELSSFNQSDRYHKLHISYGVTVLINVGVIIVLWTSVHGQFNAGLGRLVALPHVDRMVFWFGALVFCTRSATVVVQHLLLPLRFANQPFEMSVPPADAAQVGSLRTEVEGLWAVVQEVTATVDAKLPTDPNRLSPTPTNTNRFRSNAAADPNATNGETTPLISLFGWQPNNGSIIGNFERVLAFLLVYNQQYSALGFVLTAKSIARMKKLEDEHFAEYYLIGTFCSMTLAFFLGYVGQHLFPT